jgi:hypothetical protein
MEYHEIPWGWITICAICFIIFIVEIQNAGIDNSEDGSEDNKYWR